MRGDVHATKAEVGGRAGLYLYCSLVFLFLVAPLLAIVPLSFNSGIFLTYPLQGVSTRWYSEFFGSERWLAALWNSVFVALVSTALAVTVGTAASIGLVRLGPRLRSVLTALIISPIIVPVVITGVGLYFLFAPLGLTSSYLGLILAHTVLSVPFVVITVSATLQGFDNSLLRAGMSLGASPLEAFVRVMLPIIAPGVISGALFAFAISFDEVVVTLFLVGAEQRTLPVQMYLGVREEINPTITAAASILLLMSIVMLFLVELLRRRSERMRGLSRK